MLSFSFRSLPQINLATLIVGRKRPVVVAAADSGESEEQGELDVRSSVLARAFRRRLKY